MVLENKEKKMGIEIQFLDWLQTLHSPIVDKMMLGITHLGDAGIFLDRVGGHSAFDPENEKERIDRGSGIMH